MKSSPPSREEIACAARELWLSRGSPTGADLEIWLEAERSLAASQRGPSAARKPASRRRDTDTVDEDKLADRLADFGEPDRRSATSAEPN